MPPRLLLTGATGFIGYYIAHALSAAGRSFAALVRPGSDVSYLRELGDRCTLREGDITDPESLADALRDVDTVVHAAARVTYQPGQEDVLLKVNGGGTANLVNMMLATGVDRLIHLSSVAALNRVSGGRAVTLNDRWPLERPNTAYARSKFAAEREVWRGQAEGLSVAALYPAIVLGAGDWMGENTPALWRMAAEERGFYPTGSSGFVDVRDVAAAAITLIDRDTDGERFLLSAENLGWKEVLTAIAASIGAKPPGYRMAPWQSALLWPVERLRARVAGSRPLITRDTHRNVQSNFSYDGTAFSRATGRAYIPVMDCIRETGKAFTVARAMGEPPPPMHLPLLESR